MYTSMSEDPDKQLARLLMAHVKKGLPGDMGPDWDNRMRAEVEKRMTRVRAAKLAHDDHAMEAELRMARWIEDRRREGSPRP